MSRRGWSSVMEVAVLSGGLAIAGCPSETPMADAGCPGPSDAGCPGASDAGCPGPSDAGCPGPSDAGCPGPSDAGCPGPSDAGCPGASALPADPAMWAAWLATESYLSWNCDATMQAPLADSPHGQNIICINDTLDGARDGAGPYPVGSAAVKITFDAAGNRVGRYIDTRQEAAAGAASWYFYVEGGPQGRGDSMATAGCAGCHASGGRDYVRRLPAP